MFFRRDNRGQRSDGSVFFLFVGVLGTVVLGSVVLGSVFGGRLSVGEQPDIVALLERSDAPQTVGDVLQVPLGSPADSLSLFVYTVDGRRRAGLVGWSRQLGEYRLVDEVRLDIDGALLAGLELESAATREDGLEMFRISAGGEVGRAVVWVGASATDLTAFSLCLPEGVCGQPLVLSAEDRLEFIDLVGDGEAELVVTRSDGLSEVYAWRAGARLKYDRSLSAALNAREGLFPEP